jgi:primosomal protein N'
MYLYTVSLILEFAPVGDIVYFSKYLFEIGNVIEVDFGNRKVLGLILKKENLENQKGNLRNSSFALKKINESKIVFNIENYFLEKIEKFAKENSVFVGEVIYKIKNYLNFTNIEKNSNKIEITVIDDQQIKIFENIESLDLIIFADDLSLSVFKQNYDYKKYKNKIYKLYDFIKSFSFQENPQLKKVVILDFNFNNYSTHQKPFLNNLKIFFLILEIINFQGKLFLQTNYLAVNEKYFLEQNFSKINYKKNENKISKKIVKDKINNQNLKSELISPIIFEKIIGNLKENKSSFLFILQHGFAKRLYCEDCNFAVSCQNCKKEIGLIVEENERVLFCNYCEFRKKIKEEKNLRCENCGGFRIFDFGAGIQKIANYLNENLEEKWKNKVVFIDENYRKKSDKKIIEEVKNAIYNKKILIGSIKNLKAIYDKVDTTFIISFGILLNQKNFSFDEKVAEIFYQIESKSNEIYIQQNKEDEELWLSLKNKEEFVNEELKSRKIAKLPPFTKVVNIACGYRFIKQVKKLVENLEVSNFIYENRKINFYFFSLLDNPIINELKTIADVKVSNIIEKPSFWKK